MAAVPGEKVFAGIEGGATHTVAVLLKEDGSLLAEAEGLSSNPWQLGPEESAKRIIETINEAKKKAGIDSKTPLETVGMSISGGDNKEIRDKVRDAVNKAAPNLCRHLYIACDTEGPIATATEEGGVVLIAGTGSNCEVRNPDGSRHRVGGWGHFIGDEGSACWITRYVLKKIFNALDNFDPNPLDITVAHKIMCDYFGVTDQMGMLEPFYGKFEKSFFSGMCKEVARCASEQKDPLCIEAFNAAGKALGVHVLALGPKINTSLLQVEGGLHVVCVGSVWKSWDLMKDGFLEAIKPRNDKDVKIGEISLMRLRKTAAFGAAYLGANSAGQKINADYKQNADVFFHNKL